MEKPRHIVTSSRLVHGVPVPFGTGGALPFSEQTRTKRLMDLKPLPPIYRGPRGSGEITALAAWAREELIIPSGLRAGKPFEIQLWQKKFLREAWRAGSSKLAFPVREKMGNPACSRSLCLVMFSDPCAAPIGAD